MTGYIRGVGPRPGYTPPDPHFQPLGSGSFVEDGLEHAPHVPCPAFHAIEDSRTVQPGEVRSVDPRTGAQKGTKLARFDLVPVGPLTELAEHYGRGAGKYADNQWRAGYDWSKSYAAALRHLTAFWSGEDFDPDPMMEGSTHLQAAAWHIFCLMEFFRTFPEGDDRWKGASGE